MTSDDRQGGYAGLDQRARPACMHALTTACARSFPHRYADFTNVHCNPFSNKIVLMDEVRKSGTARPACTCSPRRLDSKQVHNLVRPSADILRNEKHMLMLQRLRQLLRTAENSVIIGLTGTPLSDVPAEAR